MRKTNIFAGLKRALQRFEETGKYAAYGNWSIAKGGYDLYWELYYKNKPVLQCIAGELSGEFGFEYEKELIERVKQIYTDVK